MSDHETHTHVQKIEGIGAEKAEELFQRLLKQVPKGFAASSMGKFNEFRKWLADELSLGDFSTKTYAVGSAGIAHNFSARWAQNNKISGSHVPLGIAFLSVPSGVNEGQLVETANNTSEKFVDGTRPTSFEAIITFVQPAGELRLKAHSILALPDSQVAIGLLKLFPELPVRTVEWKRSQLPTGIGPTVVQAKENLSKPLNSSVVEDLRASLLAANYQTTAGLPDRVLSSLAAKPFLILAGLSGSGKTLLGIMVSHWLSAAPEQVAVVAVGADWTSKHHLLGHPDALDSERFVKTPAIDILLRASVDSDMPYFLILDEMNLSHVERYFSDFLSAIESSQPIYLHGGENDRDGVPATLPFPGNLFVIGTVNIDETTYMFSPKVLDRANVIEFTVTREAMRSFLDGGTRFDGTSILGAGAAYGGSMVEFVKSDPGLGGLDSAEAACLIESLDRLFVSMDGAGLQFGYRTAREIVRYALAEKFLLEEKWNIIPILDAQIVQRIVPRLNGDAARLRPILTGLLAFCLASAEEIPADLTKIMSESAALRQASQDALQAKCLQLASDFPLSAEKIGRMLARLREHGFTTAIEA